MSGTLCCRRSSIRYVTAEAHGQGCGLRTSIPLLPEYRHPKEPAAPTVCVSGAVCGGPAAFAESLAFPLRPRPHVLRSMYGGATFEIKKCSFISPGGTYHHHRCCSRPIYPLGMAYTPAIGQVLPIYPNLRHDLHSPDIAETDKKRTQSYHTITRYKRTADAFVPATNLN